MTDRAGDRNEHDVPAHLRTTQEIPIGAGGPDESDTPPETERTSAFGDRPETGPARETSGTGEASGPPRASVRPAAVTDVQVSPAVPPPEPPPRPYTAPTTVEERLPSRPPTYAPPSPGAGPGDVRRPTGPGAGARRPSPRALAAIAVTAGALLVIGALAVLFG